MPSRQPSSGGGNRGPSLEAVFACVVITACFCSILIAHFSRSDTVYLKRKRAITFKAAPVNDFKEKLETSGRTDDTVNDHVVLRTPENEAAASDVILPWFQPVPVPGIAPDERHPYFRGYIIENRGICRNQRVDILIYMHSEVGHFASRTVLRNTWASVNNFKDIRVKTVFFLGEAALPEDGPGVSFEQTTYNDIVQGDFLDVFKNLAVKSVMVSQWISRHCAHARYVIKADDDMFLDIFRVVEFLIPRISKSPRTLMCHFQRNASRLIQREPQNRWYVPPDLLPERTHYPDFCSGYAMLITTDVMRILYQGTFKAPLIAVDDAFLFGLSAPVQKPLNYIDIARNLSLQQDAPLQNYVSGASVTHVACRVKDATGFRLLWNASLARLTQWARHHASRRVHQLRRPESARSGRTARSG